MTQSFKHLPYSELDETIGSAAGIMLTTWAWTMTDCIAGVGAGLIFYHAVQALVSYV